MHNLGTVIRFEVVRTLKKKSFWLMAFGFPLMMAVIFGIIFFSNQSTSDAASELEKQQFSLAVTDKSGFVDRSLLKTSSVTTTDDKATGIDQVRNGNVDAYIYYPADIDVQSIEVYGRDVGLFDNGRYDAVAESLLLQSVQKDISPEIQTIVQKKTTQQTTIYRDGEVYEPVKQMIWPGMFLVLFYLLIAFFGGQMLTSTTEEKENRVIEMLLTTIEARTLIVGKIISLIGLALFQAVLIVAPALIGYLLLRDSLELPALDISGIPVDWARIAMGALLFMTSFVLFTGLLVLIGAMVPTAKEASQFMGLVMMLIFGPLYAASLFVSAPDNGVVTFLSLFPFTAPIPLMLRNAVGNLELWEAGFAIAILSISAVIVSWLAVRVFRYGVLEYSRKLTWRDMLPTRRP